jgi:hypothetical protein
MHDGIANVMIHINESLAEPELRTLEDDMRENLSVVAVGHNPKRPHLLLVAYDSDMFHATDFMHGLHNRGLHAQLVGL